MVNTNIQAPIPIEGTGYIAKRKNNYERGEYKHLTNAEIALDGVLKTRRNIKATQGEWSMTNPFGFIGYIQNYSIIASATEQRATSKALDVLLWAPTALPVPAGGWHKLVGAFRYNKFNYWITVEYNPTGTVYKVCLYSSNKELSTIVFADLTRTEILSVTTNPNISNFFIHKERLFISTDAFVYFSKATDPKVFAVPDGGFVGIADTKINFSFSLSDSIFIMGDNSTHIYSYSVDPNADGYMRAISTTVGGEHGVVHQSQPYIINKTGLYAITNSMVEKVNDTMLDLGENVYRSKILSFEDYLVIVRYQDLQYNSVAVTSADYPKNLGKIFTPYLADNANGYNVFFLNTRNGSTHVVDFTDARDMVNKGYIVDAMVNPNRDASGEYRLMFLTNRYESLAAPNYTYKGSTYYMETQRITDVADTVRTSANVITKYKPNILIEIDSFVPDGSEHLMKKFRHMLMMAKFPSSDFGVLVVYDNRGYGSKVPTVLINDITEGRAHYPSRVGLNQRGRSLTFRLMTLKPDVALGASDWDELELSDIRVLWTYTSRAIEKKSQTVSNFI
jgi:hypothetical protein